MLRRYSRTWLRCVSKRNYIILLLLYYSIIIINNVLKGFWKGVDGVTEHTEMLAHILNTAKREQRSIYRGAT